MNDETILFCGEKFFIFAFFLQQNMYLEWKWISTPLLQWPIIFQSLMDFWVKMLSTLSLPRGSPLTNKIICHWTGQKSITTCWHLWGLKGWGLFQGYTNSWEWNLVISYTLMACSSMTIVHIVRTMLGYTANIPLAIHNLRSTVSQGTFLRSSWNNYYLTKPIWLSLS